MAVHRAAFAVAFVALVRPGSARAWAFEEHQEIGREAYLQACEWLTNNKRLDATARNLVDHLVCNKREIDQLARRFGQATALSGDHLSGPERFAQLEGQREATSLTVYALRALEDADHFHPRAPELWARHHAEALERAVVARRLLEAQQGTSYVRASEEARALLAVMLAHAAFGDHFLQDSFAGGHMGFNRVSSRPTASNIFHNKHNYRGRVVKNRRGEVWVTHGDNQLEWSKSARKRVVSAASISTYDVLLAFVRGKAKPAVGNAARDELPIAFCDDSAADCQALRTKLRSAACEPHECTEDGDWVPADYTFQPAQLEILPGFEYRHTLDFSPGGLVRNQLNFVASGPVLSSYGLRWDLRVGVVPPSFRSSSATSLFGSLGIDVPIHASYGSFISFDLTLGALVEQCINECDPQPGYERGMFGGYVGPQFNLEFGKFLVISAFAQPLLAVDWSGEPVGGIAFGVGLGKGTHISEPKAFPGPPL